MRIVLRWLIACLMLVSSQAPTAEPVKERPPFRGGPLDGVGVGEVIRPDNGVRIVGLKPSKPNASPVPAGDMPAIRAFTEAFEKRDFTGLDAFLAKGAKHEACAHGFYGRCATFGKFALDVHEDCTFNTPYYLGKHVVRLEWLFKGELWYWSEVYLSNGKIALVRTHPADMPPQRPF